MYDVIHQVIYKMSQSFKQKMRLLVEGVGSTRSTPSWAGEAAEKAWV